MGRRRYRTAEFGREPHDPLDQLRVREREFARQVIEVILDADATIDKAIDLLGDAADDGATLVVFPECFVSLYPSGAWAASAATWSRGCDELWERMWASSVDVDGPSIGWRRRAPNAASMSRSG